MNTCTKRRFSSPGALRKAHTHASFTLRSYWCATCHAYHAANRDKRKR